MTVSEYGPRLTIDTRDPEVLLKRAIEAAEQALEHLDRCEFTAARQSLQAAIEPERLRWSDK